VARQPTLARMVARGLVARCPRCGSGGVFESWFRMRARCPSCGYRFDRGRAEEGFFLGGYTMNLGITFAVLGVVMVAVIVLRQTTDVGLGVLLVIGLGAAALVPVVAWPSSRTLWAAFDLAMRPLDAEETADAAAHASSSPRSSPSSPPAAGTSPRR
jgi:uncharacterized protein (DUF983 family)